MLPPINSAITRFDIEYMVFLAFWSSAHCALRNCIVLQAGGGVLCRTQIAYENLWVGPNHADRFEGC